MDAFAGYGSGSASDSDGGEDAPAAGGAAEFRPAWQQADDDDDASTDEDKDDYDKAKTAKEAPPRAGGAGGADTAPPVAKKRKLIDPFAALSQASASFLAAGKAGRDEPEFFSAAAREGDQDRPAAPGASVHTEPGREGAAAADPAPPAPPAAAPAAKPAKPKEETTRQKNARKQARGQANFTVKSNRECPDIWQGPGS